MIKNIVIYFLVIAYLSVEIDANVCRFITTKTVNVTESYTYSYFVTYYGECYFGKHCLLSRWETRVKNRTIEKPDIEIERRCCPGWRDISTNRTRHHDNDDDLVCIRETECIGPGPCQNTTSTMDMDPTTYNATSNGTSMYKAFMWNRTTTTERPQYANNDSMPYHWRYTTSTERNKIDTVPYYRRYTTTTERNYNDTLPYYRRSYYGRTRHVPYYRRYTTSTERNYNDTIPYYRRYTTSTERNYNDTVPYRWWYTTSTERNYNDTIPYYRSYTTSTERNYNDTVPYRWWYTTSTERNYNDTIPYYRRYTTSTERNYNDTVPYRWWYTTSTERNYNDTMPYYRRYTTSTERNYNDTVPYRWWYTTSTERNYNDTIPYYRSYTTSTERNYNDTVPYRWWYTTSTERNYNDTIPYYRRYTTSTERNYNDTVPYHRRYTTSTERLYYGPVKDVRSWRHATSTELPGVVIYSYDTNYEEFPDIAPTSNISTGEKVSLTDSNATKIFDSHNWSDMTSTGLRNLDKTESASTNYSIPSSNTEWHTNTSKVSYETDTTWTKDRTSNNTELNPSNNTITYSIRSLPDISEPYRPYNWNNTTYKRNTPTDDYRPFTYTTSAVDTDVADKDKEKQMEPMCPRQRWILILTTLILVFTAYCVTLIVWRVISLKKYKIRGRSLINQGLTNENEDMYNATYTSTETKAKINNIYPSTDL